MYPMVRCMFEVLDRFCAKGSRPADKSLCFGHLWQDSQVLAEQDGRSLRTVPLVAEFTFSGCGGNRYAAPQKAVCSNLSPASASASRAIQSVQLSVVVHREVLFKRSTLELFFELWAFGKRTEQSSSTDDQRAACQRQCSIHDLPALGWPCKIELFAAVPWSWHSGIVFRNILSSGV